MKINFSKWLRITYNKITNSIAFYPALIAVGFLLLSWIMLEIDFSPWGKQMKSGIAWLSLKDTSTARSIISTVAGAIISLTVFSFSMVMIVLNQAASQMSNRVLTSMIENRFQQIVLGFYIGTIVYALFLLSTIRDIESGIYIPALSIYLLIFLTIIDIFLFIYFLDYVTQTVKYETVINRVKQQTLDTMEENFSEEQQQQCLWGELPFLVINAPESNYFQGVNDRKLVKSATEKDYYVAYLHLPSTFVVKGLPLARIYSKHQIKQEFKDDVIASTDLFSGQPINKNSDYGFNQLAEIAIKALSPGINDPGTAVISLHALSDLFSYRLYRYRTICKPDENEIMRVFLPSSTFKDLFHKCIDPIWNYGKDDDYIQDSLISTISQLKALDHKGHHLQVFDNLINKVQAHKKAK